MTELLTQDIFQIKTSDQILSGLETYCKTHDCSFAAWRMPSTDEIQVIINFSECRALSADDQLEELDPGFICAPFDRSNTAHFIAAEAKIDFKKKSIEFKPGFSAECEKLVKYLSGTSLPQTTPYDVKEEYNGVVKDEEESSFKNLVTKAIEGINQHTFQKVVPSRVKKISLKENFNAAVNFLRLCDAYPNAFVSYLYSSKVGLWLGATPEILIKTNNLKGQFETVALAGTQKFNDTQSLADVAWTQKEIEEQAFVSRYIINCFKKIRLREFDELGPKTIKAGNLIHLKTTFLVDMKETNFPLLGSVMMNLLHPTSAVCGMPLDTSLNFLKKHEGVDRKLFSGYIGPVDNHKETALFVNLRCMEISKNEATLYAGAGVTEDSNPEKEWLETEMKMKTLLNIIR